MSGQQKTCATILSGHQLNNTLASWRYSGPPFFSSDFSALITLFPSPLRQYGCRFLSAWERQSNCNRHLKSPAGHVTPHPQTRHSQAGSACGAAAGHRAKHGNATWHTPARPISRLDAGHTQGTACRSSHREGTTAILITPATQTLSYINFKNIKTKNNYN